MNSINILYLHNKSEISGGERSLLNLWENLNRKIFIPFLIIPEDGKFSIEAKKLNVDVSFLTISQLHPKNLFKIAANIFMLLIFYKKNKIRLIHSYTPRNNIVAAIAGKISGIPIIWHERNILLKGEKDINKQFFFLADRTICNSHAVAEKYAVKGRLSSKVRVILNGVNLDKFNPLIKNIKIKKQFGIDAKKVVGIITNFSKRKRLEYFITVAAELLKKNNDLVFMILGGEFASNNSDSHIKELIGLAEKLGIKNKVIFCGFKDNVSEILSCFDIFAHVAVKEACSRAILESMAMAKPVVAINDGGNPELVEDGVTGLLIQPDYSAINSFVKALEYLINNNGLRHAMGKKARERVEKYFDVKRNARQTEDVYRELI